MSFLTFVMSVAAAELIGLNADIILQNSNYRPGLAGFFFVLTKLFQYNWPENRKEIRYGAHQNR